MIQHPASPGNNDLSTTFKSSVEGVIDNKIGGYWYQIPCVLNNVNLAQRTADCIPQCSIRTPQGQVVNLPVILGVRIAMPGSGIVGMEYPVFNGQNCWIETSDRAMTDFIQKGAVVADQTGRKHSLSDAIAWPVPLSTTAIGQAGDISASHWYAHFGTGAGAGVVSCQQGKVAFGSGPNELVDLIIQALTMIAGAQVTTTGSAGTFPVMIPPDQLVAILSSLNAIKGTLPVP